MGFLCFLLLLSSVFTLFSGSVDGRLVNVTVDDSNPDPLTGVMFTYLPALGWNSGDNRKSCTADPDPSLAHDGTWHQPTYADPQEAPAEDEVQTAGFQFNGSALYVYGILSHLASDPRTTTDLSFIIDGQLSGTFTFVPSIVGENSYTYDALLYANDSIEPGLHSVMLQNWRSGGNDSLVLLDYVVYTREDDTTAISSNINPASDSAISLLGSASIVFPTKDIASIPASFNTAPAGPYDYGTDIFPTRPSAAATPSALIDTATNTGRAATRTVIVACILPPILVFAVVASWLCGFLRRRDLLRRNLLAKDFTHTVMPGELPAGAAPISAHRVNNDARSLEGRSRSTYSLRPTSSSVSLLPYLDTNLIEARSIQGAQESLSYMLHIPDRDGEVLPSYDTLSPRCPSYTHLDAV